MAVAEKCIAPQWQCDSTMKNQILVWVLVTAWLCKEWAQLRFQCWEESKYVLRVGLGRS